MVFQCQDLDDLKDQLGKAGDKLVVIDFYAMWCGPCKMIAPKIEEMEAAMQNVVFLKVDVDEAEDAAQEYNITAMPTFILIKNKNKVSVQDLTLVELEPSWQKIQPVFMSVNFSGCGLDGRQPR